MASTPETLMADFEALLSTSPGLLSSSRGLRHCVRQYRTAKSSRMRYFWASLALEALHGNYPHGYTTSERLVPFDEP